jgi:outer membrane protein assembly factor BamB
MPLAQLRRLPARNRTCHVPQRLMGAAFGVFALVVSASTAAAADFVSGAALGEANLVKYWQLQLPLDPGQELQRAYLVDDQVYACTTDGYVFAIHARTGALRWVQPVTQSRYVIPRPCHVGNTVVFALPPEIRVFNRTFGDPIKRVSLRFPADSPPSTDGVRVFLGGVDRRMHAFDTENYFEAWKVLTEGQVTSAAAFYGENLYFASQDGRVYACNSAEKTLAWKSATFGPITADLVATEDGVFVASRDRSLYLFDVIYGQTRWRVRFSGSLYEAPVVIGDIAYQYCPLDGVVAINVDEFDEEKRVRWRLPNGRMTLTSDADYTYVLTRDETIAVVGRQVAHSIPAPGLIMPMPDVTNMSIILAGVDGRIFCARPADAPYLRAEEVQASLRAGGATPGSEPSSQPVAGDREFDPAEEAIRQAQEVIRRSLIGGKPGGPAPGGRSKVTREYGRGGSGGG